jgi:hypothetical protein
MAIQISLTEEQTSIGVSAPEAYARIVVYTHDIKRDALQMAVEFHYNAAARVAGRNPIRGISYQLGGDELSGTGGIRPQLYEWLKARPEFNGGIDV